MFQLVEVKTNWLSIIVHHQHLKDALHCILNKSWIAYKSTKVANKQNFKMSKINAAFVMNKFKKMTTT
jgi:hypothetical protein